MESPLGRAVGNSLEVAESVDSLRGEGPRDLRELVVMEGAMVLVNGKAMEKFIQMLSNQVHHIQIDREFDKMD